MERRSFFALLAMPLVAPFLPKGTVIEDVSGNGNHGLTSGSGTEFLTTDREIRRQLGMRIPKEDFIHQYPLTEEDCFMTPEDAAKNFLETGNPLPKDYITMRDIRPNIKKAYFEEIHTKKKRSSPRKAT